MHGFLLLRGPESPGQCLTQALGTRCQLLGRHHGASEVEAVLPSPPLPKERDWKGQRDVLPVPTASTSLSASACGNRAEVQGDTQKRRGLVGANLPLASLLAGGRWELKSSPCSCAQPGSQAPGARLPGGS